MKSTLLTLLLLWSTLTLAQRNPLADQFSCASKAIMLDGPEVTRKAMTDVTSLMCECQPFAFGTNLIVYLEEADNVSVTTVFSFNEGKCCRTSIRIAYVAGDDGRDERAAQLTRYFKDLYGDKVNATQAPAYYSLHSPIRSHAWVGAHSYLQMDVMDERSKSMIEVTRIYK